MTLRILVVDDDHSMVRTLCDVFRLKGWAPHGAYSGEEAVAVERAAAFDAVLIDVKMPGMDGVTAFKLMKARKPDVKVVLMTAHLGEDVLREAQDAGALRVMSKPVDLDVLIALLGER